MSANYAPIAYFAFNRPAHTARTLAALAANPLAKATDLHVFVDGARNEAERSLVTKVLDTVRTVPGFRTVVVHASETNQGLYCAITGGVSRVLAGAGRVIVVEDDILVSPFFLTYMNEGLDRFESDLRVGSIHAYSPPIAGLPDHFFLRGGDCWGWATWTDRWSLYREDTRELVSELVANGQLDAYLNIYGHHSLVHLIKRAWGRNFSWASNWHASLFLAGKLTLHPGRSHVENIGNDGTGTHAADSGIYATDTTESYDGIGTIHVLHNNDCAKAMRDFMDGVARETPYKTFRRKLITLLFKWNARLIFAKQRIRTGADV